MLLLSQRLRHSLAADPLQPAGWQRWLDGAGDPDALVRSCPEPGWLLYLACFRQVDPSKLLLGVLAVARRLMEESGGEPPLTQEEWELLVRAERRSPTELARVVARLHQRCHDLPDAPGELPLAGSQATMVDAAVMLLGLEGPGSQVSPPGDPDLAMLFLALASLRAKTGNGQDEIATSLLAKSVALAAKVMPAQKTAMVEDLQGAFDWREPHQD
jgi:hypothetical protein